MAIILEDGTGIEGANSYIDQDAFEEYAETHGIELASDVVAEIEAALIRASAAIDARYYGAYPGDRAKGRSQGLQWPRIAAYDSSGWLIGDDEIPVEVINATCEAAIRELQSPGSMMPDLERGGQIQSIRAGSVGITYSAAASAQTTFTLIDGIMSNILNGAGNSGGGLFGTAVRS